MLGWELPPHNSGGLGVACYHLAKALADEGANIDFVLPYSAHHPDTEWMNIHSTDKMEADERRYTMMAYSGIYEDIRKLQASYVSFVEKFAEENTPDVIHAHDWLTMEAGVRAKEVSGAPLIVHVHATEFDRSGSDEGNPIIHEIEYHGLMMADRIFAVSNITKAIIIQKYGIPADKIEVVYNALDVGRLGSHNYDYQTYNYLEFLKSEGYTVVSAISRLTIQKGLTYLVQAVAKATEQHDKFVLLIAGDGEQREELIQLAADLGISDRVLFTGFVRGKQWRDAYCVSDIFVMSSISEPFGLTALEAAHHDTALIISNQSGVSELLHSILRYDFWDTDALADQLVAVATNPELMESLKQGVRNEYAQISWSDVAKKCIYNYRMLQGGAGS